LKKVMMGVGMRPRSISLYFLLIAAAVQGLTPDANDLASTTLFPLLASVASGTAGTVARKEHATRPDSPVSRDASLPSWDEDGEPLPGEICDPARLPAGQVRSHAPRDGPRLETLRIDPQHSLIESSHLHLFARHAWTVCSDDLTLALCRLLC
jgi:hypothetical protein